jgi:hypothetical protein
MLKRFFDWTPADVAAWEKLRARGPRRFVLWYGVQLFAGLLFLFLGGTVLLLWVKDVFEHQAASISGLVLELLLIALACLLGGLITGTATWLVEERIYLKIVAQRSQTTASKGKT